MKKLEVELRSYPKSPIGYAVMPWSEPSEADIYEKMTEVLTDKKYIKHFIDRRWTPVPHYCHYVPESDRSMSILQGDLTYYLVIFYEDKE
jgi:hypothetical protein